MPTKVEILTVDDLDAFTELNKSYLERHPEFSVTAANSVEQALNLLDTNEFDCIISDYDMGCTTGIDLYNRVKENHPNLPFFLFTTYSNVSDRDDADGLNGVYSKNNIPDVYDSLSTAISQAV